MHPTTQPESAKRRIAKETLEELANDSTEPIPAAGDMSVWCTTHWHDKEGDLRVDNSKFPDGWGITSVSDCETHMLVRVGPLE